MITPRAVSSATISAVKIRAVTLGLDLPVPQVVSAPFEGAARFLSVARASYAAAGIEVQTTRVAGADLGASLHKLQKVPAWAAQTEAAARGAGIDYLSLGRVPASAHQLVEEQLAPILAAGEIAFLSADLIDKRLPCVAMAAACAKAVKQLA